MLKVLVGQIGIGAVLAAALWGLYGHMSRVTRRCLAA